MSNVNANANTNTNINTSVIEKNNIPTNVLNIAPQQIKGGFSKLNIDLNCVDKYVIENNKLSIIFKSETTLEKLSDKKH